MRLTDTDVARGVAVAGDGDAPDVWGQGIVAHALGPLDHDDGAFVGQEFVEIDGVGRGGAFVEAVEVDVVELQASVVRIDERERGTRDFFFVDAEGGANSFDEDRFAGAECAAQEEYLAARELRAELVAVVESLVRRRADELALGNVC